MFIFIGTDYSLFICDLPDLHIAAANPFFVSGEIILITYWGGIWTIK